MEKITNIYLPWWKLNIMLIFNGERGGYCARKWNDGLRGRALNNDSKNEALKMRSHRYNLCQRHIPRTSLLYECQCPCSHNCEKRMFFAQNMPKTIDLSPRRLSVDRHWNYWLESQSTWVPDVCPSTDTETICLESQSSVLWTTQKLLTHIPAVCPLTTTTTNDSLPRRLSSDRYIN